MRTYTSKLRRPKSRLIVINCGVNLRSFLFLCLFCKCATIKADYVIVQTRHQKENICSICSKTILFVCAIYPFLYFFYFLFHSITIASGKIYSKINKRYNYVVYAARHKRILWQNNRSCLALYINKRLTSDKRK